MEKMDGGLKETTDKSYRKKPEDQSGKILRQP